MFPKEFDEGSVIISQGADGDNFYVLDSGVCEVYKDDKLVQTVGQDRMEQQKHHANLALATLLLVVHGGNVLW